MAHPGDHEHGAGPTAAYRFGPFLLDGRTLELRRGGVRVPLEPLPTRILIDLVASAGRMRSRAELRAVGWPRLPGVADDSLNTCVRQIRDALGDDAGAPRYLETLRGRGYRFREPVQVVPPPSGKVGAAPPLRRRMLVLAACAALLLAGSHGPAVRAASPVPSEVRAELAKVRHLMDRGDMGAALAMADAGVQSFPDRAELHGARAEVLVLLGQEREAWNAASAALSMAGAEPRALRATALLHALSGRWGPAGAAADLAVDADPGGAGNLVVRAWVRALRGDGAGARSDIRHALEVDPLSPVIHHDAGQIHLWIGDAGRAREACEEMLQLGEHVSWALMCALDAAVLEGDQAAAASLAQRILATHESPGHLDGDDDVERVWHLRLASARRDGGPYAEAVALTALGRTAEALDALERAVQAGGFGVLAAGVDPRLTSLRGEPRYRMVLARLGLSGVGALS